MRATMGRISRDITLVKLAKIATGMIEFVLLHLGDLALCLQDFAIAMLQLHQFLDDRAEALLVQHGIKPGGNFRDAGLECEFCRLTLIHIRPGPGAHGLALGLSEPAPKLVESGKLVRSIHAWWGAFGAAASGDWPVSMSRQASRRPVTWRTTSVIPSSVLVRLAC